MTELKTSEVLDRAADFMEDRGFRQGNWGHTADGQPVCIEGAIFAVLGVPDVDELGDEAYMDLQQCPSFLAVKEYVGYRGSTLYGWNDWHERTKEEVVEALRGAAEAERQKEQQ